MLPHALSHYSTRRVVALFKKKLLHTVYIDLSIRSTYIFAVPVSLTWTNYKTMSPVTDQWP